MAAFSRHRDALVWARHRAESDWGPLALESPYFAFDYTSYYSRTMGTGLEKVLWLFEPWGDPAALAQRKLSKHTKAGLLILTHVLKDGIIRPTLGE